MSTSNQQVARIGAANAGRIKLLPNICFITVKLFLVKWNAEVYSCEYGSAKYYALCGVGGLLSCGVTHTLMTPLDMVKCRIQANPAKYKSTVNGFKVLRFKLEKK